MEKNVLAILISALLVLVVFAIGVGGFTGFAVLPTTSNDRAEVVEYVKQTEEFERFKSMVLEEPELAETYLCYPPYSADKCKIISNNIEKLGWTEDYYWYLSFSGKRWMGRTVDAEFWINADTGVVVRSHVDR